MFLSSSHLNFFLCSCSVTIASHFQIIYLILFPSFGDLNFFSSSSFCSSPLTTVSLYQIIYFIFLCVTSPPPPPPGSPNSCVTSPRPLPLIQLLILVSLLPHAHPPLVSLLSTTTTRSPTPCVTSVHHHPPLTHPLSHFSSPPPCSPTP